MNAYLSTQNLVEDYLATSFYATRKVVVIMNPLDFLNSLLAIPELNLTLDNLLECKVAIVLVSNINVLRSVRCLLAEIKGLEFSCWSNNILIGGPLSWTEPTDISDVPVLIRIDRSRHGIPVIGVGGGALSATFSGRWVLNSRRLLKRALFIKKPINTTSDVMALVPLEKSDIIVTASGRKPASFDNPDCIIKAYKIVLLSAVHVECIDISDMITEEFLPPSVLVGLHRYHNRDGKYFCEGTPFTPKSKKVASPPTTEKGELHEKGTVETESRKEENCSCGTASEEAQDCSCGRSTCEETPDCQCRSAAIS
jgi:hypothetical protein